MLFANGECSSVDNRRSGLRSGHWPSPEEEKATGNATDPTMARLTRAEIEAELEAIAELITAHPGSLNQRSVGNRYVEAHGKQLSSRTLQRRLEELTARRRIAPAGVGPSTVYERIGPRESSALEPGYVPLTAEGAKARTNVRQPTTDRPPVGYDPGWLREYQPGKTWYLPRSTRLRLEHQGRIPGEDRPAGTFARDILGRLLIDLSWASSRLEGNTYTRLETKNLLEFGQRAEGKDALEAQMILNHKAAIEYLVSGAENVGFNRRTIQTLHAALSENLLGDAADEGRLRRRPVEVTGTAYTPTAIPQLIEECLETILRLASAIPDPFEQAFFVMVHVPYLQPFSDVNKRTSRLAANIPLIAANLCPLSFVDVPERAYIEGTLAVYERKDVALLRDVFVFAYERSCAQYRVVRDSLGTPDPTRLRYRSQLAGVVAETVRAGEPPAPESLRRRARVAGVPEQDLDAVAHSALEVLLGLHEGSAGRYGLRPTEFETWRTKFGARSPV